MKEQLINNGIEPTEQRQMTFESALFLLIALLTLSTIIFSCLYANSLNNEKQYLYKMHEKDSLNASLHAINNELTYDNLNRK